MTQPKIEWRRKNEKYQKEETKPPNRIINYNNTRTSVVVVVVVVWSDPAYRNVSCTEWLYPPEILLITPWGANNAIIPNTPEQIASTANKRSSCSRGDDDDDQYIYSTSAETTTYIQDAVYPEVWCNRVTTIFLKFSEDFTCPISNCGRFQCKKAKSVPWQGKKQNRLPLLQLLPLSVVGVGAPGLPIVEFSGAHKKSKNHFSDIK